MSLGARKRGRLTPDFPPELVEFDALCLTRDVARRADTEYLLAWALAMEISRVDLAWAATSQLCVVSTRENRGTPLRHPKCPRRGSAGCLAGNLLLTLEAHPAHSASLARFTSASESEYRASCS